MRESIFDENICEANCRKPDQVSHLRWWIPAVGSALYNSSSLMAMLHVLPLDGTAATNPSEVEQPPLHLPFRTPTLPPPPPNHPPSHPPSPLPSPISPHLSFWLALYQCQGLATNILRLITTGWHSPSYSSSSKSTYPKLINCINRGNTGAATNNSLLLIQVDMSKYYTSSSSSSCLLSKVVRGQILHWKTTLGKASGEVAEHLKK